MECVIGIQTNDFVLLAADSRASMSICTLKHDKDKMFKFSKRILAAVCGEAGDTNQFAEYIQQNMQLYEIKNGYELTPSGAANFTRYNIAQSLRSRIPFAVHGYGSYMSLSTLDRNYKPNMSVEEAMKLLRVCVLEIKKRLVINLDRYCLRLVTKDGIKHLPDMTDLSDAA